MAQAFCLADLATCFQLFGTFQMVFQVTLRRLAEQRQFFGQSQGKVPSCDIHENRILGHVKFGLAGSHVFFSGIVGRINLEPSKYRPDNGQSRIEKHVILDPFPEIRHGRIQRRFRLHPSKISHRITDIPRHRICHFTGHSRAGGTLVGRLVTGLIIILVSLGAMHRDNPRTNFVQIDIDGVVNLGDSRRQGDGGHKAGPGLVLAALGHFDLGFFGLDLRVARLCHVKGIL